MLFSLFFPIFLFASINEEIIKFYKHYYPTIEIKSIKFNKTPPKKYKKIDFKFVNYKFPSSSILIDGKYYYFKIDATIKVFVANRVIKINELIKPNVSLKDIKFKTFHSKPLTKIENNLVASKIISKNSIINESNTKIKPTILKNEKVTVIFKNNSIEISTSGVALNDANENEKVLVKVNNKTFKGIVKNAKVIIK